MQPLVSIITPVFRSEDILTRAIGSLLAQDLKDWELVLVDDGSPEPSWRVVQSYAWLDPRIRATRQPHAGACPARNTGIAAALGEYILFLDADDWIEADALSSLVRACQANDWAAAHGTLRYVMPEGGPTSWEGGCPTQVELFDAISGSNVLSVPSSVLLRRSVLDQIGLFDASLVHCGDWDLWARLARHDAPIGRLGQCITHYRMRHGSLSRSPRTLFRDAMTVLERIHRPDARVQSPRRQFASGANPLLLGSRICYFAVYAAGLALSGGRYENVQAVLDMTPRWTPLSPDRSADFLFYALCFAHCVGPEGVSNFWPRIAWPLQRLLGDLERRTGQIGFTQEVLDAMATRSDQPLPAALPLVSSPDALDLTFPHIGAADETLALNALRSLAMRRGA